MQTPNITTAQLVAIVGSIAGTAAAFGLPISHAQTSAIVQLVTVLAPVLVVADAIIRHGRATGASARVTAAGPVPDAFPPIDAAPAQTAAQAPASSSPAAAPPPAVV